MLSQNPPVPKIHGISAAGRDDPSPAPDPGFVELRGAELGLGEGGENPTNPRNSVPFGCSRSSQSLQVTLGTFPVGYPGRNSSLGGQGGAGRGDSMDFTSLEEPGTVGTSLGLEF